MSIQRFEELPSGSFLLDDEELPVEERVVVIRADVFAHVSDYSRSLPTGPSPGRVYRKNLGWSAHVPDNWWMYFCVRDPADPEYVLHIPFKVVIV